MSAASALQPHIQRRRLRNYEQAMARLSYAYGVDVRRARWLAASTIGNSLVRAVDRRWPRLVDDLMVSELEEPREAPTELLRRIGRLRHLLRAPSPIVRVVTAQARRLGVWAPVTALGPTHGEVHWLILDLEMLGAAPPEHLDFLLGSGLGHLQCDHGVFFTAHLLAARRGPLALAATRRALAPWSKVMVFSADRAGMLATGDLPTTLAVLRARATEEAAVDWWPRWPSLTVREEALAEFDRSVVVARLRAVRTRTGGEEQVSVIPRAQAEAAPEEQETPPLPPIPEDAWSLARCDARLTARLRLL